MPINRCKDHQGRARFQFEFDRRFGDDRIRARKLLPASWTRTQADAFDRKESARLYAEAAGVETRRWTIDQAVARYLDERAIGLKTGRAVGAELQSLQEYFVGRPLAQLAEVCAEITEDYRDDVAPATLMNKLRYLCAATRWGWKRHAMSDADPAGRVIFPSVRNERQVYVDRAGMVELAWRCKDVRARAAIRIAFYSGMRLGEIERAERIFGLGAFLLADTKNGDPRLVPMDRRIVRAARVELGTRFQTGYQFRKARAAVGRDDLHFHDLRHSFASAALAGGADLYGVGKVLGHRSTASTRRYGHLSLEALRGVVDRVSWPTSSPPSPTAQGAKSAKSPMEARAGVEPTYSDLQSRKRA
jgi:integrase